MAERRVEHMALTGIPRAQRNPKEHAADVIEASISRFGVADLPVLDDRTGRLVSGHGRLVDLEARRAAGEDPPDGVLTDPLTGEWLVPVVRGWASRSDVEADAYVITANSSSALGGWHQTGLAEVLADLQAMDESLLLVTGYDADDLKGMLAAHSATSGGNGAGPPDDFPEYDEKTITTEHECPQCGYRWSGGKITVETSGGGPD